MSGYTPLKKFSENTSGRDFVVGDIHGTFSILEQSLVDINFDIEVDRLFSVGDLVDRGSESLGAIEWLKQPWFHAVRGNHEQMVLDYFDTSSQRYQADFHIMNGGAWFTMLTEIEKKEQAVYFSELPIAIEVETKDGLVGIVHADCPYGSWDYFCSQLLLEDSQRLLKDGRDIEDYCLWSRDRINGHKSYYIEGLLTLIVGHTPLKKVKEIDNVLYIDTMGWTSKGQFTLIQLGV